MCVVRCVLCSSVFHADWCALGGVLWPNWDFRHTASHKDHDGHKAVFIGDLRLTDFKSVLARAGISAVFSGGMLVSPT